MNHQSSTQPETVESVPRRPILQPLLNRYNGVNWQVLRFRSHAAGKRLWNWTSNNLRPEFKAFQYAFYLFMAVLVGGNFIVYMGWMKASDPNKIGWTENSKTSTNWWTDLLLRPSIKLLNWGNVTSTNDTGILAYYPRRVVFYAVFSLHMAWTAAGGGAVIAALCASFRGLRFLFGSSLRFIGKIFLAISECCEAVFCTLCCCCHCMGRCRRKKYKMVQADEARKLQQQQQQQQQGTTAAAAIAAASAAAPGMDPQMIATAAAIAMAMINAQQQQNDTRKRR